MTVTGLLQDGSPAESVLSCPDLVVVEAPGGEGRMEDFQESAMTQSQYAQVGALIIFSHYFVLSSGDLRGHS